MRKTLILFVILVCVTGVMAKGNKVAINKETEFNALKAEVNNRLDKLEFNTDVKANIQAGVGNRSTQAGTIINKGSEKVVLYFIAGSLFLNVCFLILIAFLTVDRKAKIKFNDNLLVSIDTKRTEIKKLQNGGKKK